MILNVEDQLKPQDTLPTMVHDQVMLTITWQHSHREDISYQPSRSYMCVGPLEPSSEHMKVSSDNNTFFGHWQGLLDIQYVWKMSWIMQLIESWN
jgi:hypothetical protein